MPKFLSDEWVEQSQAIYTEYEGKAPPPAQVIKMNLVVKECPDGVGDGGVVEAHVDTSGGEIAMDKGHLDDPQLTVTLPYEVAKAILVEQNQQAGMQAFMSGQISVTGDMTKMMAMQQGAPDPVQLEIAQKVRDITD